MKKLETQIILSNTYHLMFRPGGPYIESRGGIQKFTGWNGPMLTDSGGFQIFSFGVGSYVSELKSRHHNSQYRPQGGLVEVSEAGVLCRSYYDGSLHALTPEFSIELQCQFGADLIVVFDECTPFSDNYDVSVKALSLCQRWAQRSLVAFDKYTKGKQGLYSVIHGGIFPSLRKESAEFSNERPFFGQAIGGSLGRTQAHMEEVVAETMQHTHKDRPVHLLGIGKVADIFMGIKYGIDTFDCVHPTRIARHGCALVKPANNDSAVREYISLRSPNHAQSDFPIEPHCPCPTCQTHSRAYLHYLITAREQTVFRLLSCHNVYFMNRLMQDIRQGLQNGTMEALESQYLNRCGK